MDGQILRNKEDTRDLGLSAESVTSFTHTYEAGLMHWLCAGQSNEKRRGYES